ncbi:MULTISPECIES: TRAP transporter substrate-binding protein [Ramlibacter]|uniref:ABC transporter substrate-binding protein n=1 Tax=Ramlibacter pinisoli TaxID=2682844 RepID=A0A6N8INN9_9BURK|nr:MULTISPECIES: TRAP transporter substrate-binding protein [Ramlibacter]MBA2963510.1 TRAP transporter substrate-binding protein [Ramlibacter sp. CGMCC 1.13660]MVQ28477.1 ABC transporter substrate-binding protein [Ramlibacter pinisoli]
MKPLRLSHLVTAAAFALAGLAAHAEPVKLRVAGNLVAAGLLQQQREQPFFESFTKTTGLPIEMDYKPMDVLGVKDADGLRIIRSGLFDIVMLRLASVSRDDPTLLGPDIVGLSTDYDTARKVFDAWREPLDQRLQAKHNAKLLAAYPFGPQILFCKPAISGLADLKGKKVRVSDQSLAKFVEGLGGIPVSLSFGETQQALERGVTDCAITGPASANSGGWPEVTTHTLPLGFQVHYNAFAINLAKWNALPPEQRTKLAEAFRKFEADAWTYSRELWDDAARCNVGKDPCRIGKKFALKEVPVSAADRKVVADAVRTVSLPLWSEACDKVNDKCSAAWKQVIGPVVGLK